MKEYPTGKHEEELLNVPPAMVGWREMLNRDGTPATEVWLGGEYPFESDGKDANGKDKFKHVKASDFKIEIDAKKDFSSTVLIEAVEARNVKAKLGVDPARSAQTGDSFAIIGAAGAGLTAIPWNASWDAEVQSEVEDAHLC